jgi:hypothetical protein
VLRVNARFPQPQCSGGEELWRRRVSITRSFDKPGCHRHGTKKSVPRRRVDHGFWGCPAPPAGHILPPISRSARSAAARKGRHGPDLCSALQGKVRSAPRAMLSCTGLGGRRPLKRAGDPGVSWGPAPRQRNSWRKS